MKLRYLVYGAVFGFLLSRVGATRYDAILGMFRLTDLHLVGVIVTAIAIAAIGIALFRARVLRSRSGEPLAIAAKPMKPGLAGGALLFGAGWALSGTCPGTALAQLGEGTLLGGVTAAGILGGAYLERRLAARGDHP